MRSDNGQFLKGTHWRPEAPHWNSEWLRNEYEYKQRSTGEIATQAGTTDDAILYWLRKHGIPRRTVSQARSIKHWGQNGEKNPMHGKIGERNPRYVDGSSPERQRLYVRGEGKEFLRKILLRDGYKCSRCDAVNTGKRSLQVHHIKPWAGYPELRFNEKNVVTLCRKCHSWVHSKANKDKEYLL